MRISRRSAGAAGVAFIATGAFATTMAADPVLFQGGFTSPLASGAVLRSATGARVTGSLHVVNNSRAPLTLARGASVAPDLVDGRGEPIAFAGGANMGRAVRRGEVVSLPPGQMLTIPVSGRLRVVGDELQWQGDDGLAGAWPLASAHGPFGLRLRYQATDAKAWRGVGLTAAVPVPVRG